MRDSTPIRKPFQQPFQNVGDSSTVANASASVPLGYSVALPNFSQVSTLPINLSFPFKLKEPTVSYGESS